MNNHKNETLEEQLSDFYWAADVIRNHQQHGCANIKDKTDSVSHALWIILAIYRNVQNEKLGKKVHHFLVNEMHMPDSLICQLAMLAPAAAPAAEEALA